MWRTEQISINRPTSLEKKLKKLLANISGRCHYPGTNKYRYYGGTGIRNQLALADLTELWHRDRASQMEHPSIDRLDPTQDYTKENCRFLEFDENRKLRRPPRPNKICANCGLLFLGQRKAKFCKACGSKLRHPMRNCLECGSEFQPSKEFYKRCLMCDPETKLCTYCTMPITRSRGKDGDLIRNKHWFCSKREFGLWIASRLVREKTTGFFSANPILNA